jgi:ribosomal protein L7/L12
VSVGYEYTTAVLTHGFMGFHKGELKRGELARQLTEKGAEGWELVHVWFDQKLHGEKDGHLLIFRRSLSDSREGDRAATAPGLLRAARESGAAVVLSDPGQRPLAVIKEIQDATGFSLGDAKSLVDSAPVTVRSGLSQDEAAAIRSRLEAAGAQAHVTSYH